MKVEVYRNLHNGKLSIRDAKTKRVVGHADLVKLVDVTFHVSQAGRERVLRERRKNVHAVVRGHMVSAMFGKDYKSRSLESYKCGIDPKSVFAHYTTPIKYNPYKAGAFMLNDSPVESAEAVVIGIGGIMLGSRISQT
jgi:hypothetical protein